MKEAEKRLKPDVLVPLSVAVLPSQKRRLEKLANLTDKSQSELCREALTYLFGAYSQIKVN